MAVRRDAPACGGDQVATLADFDFFFVAGLVALSVLAAALRSAGDFAVFMVLAAVLFVSGEAAFAAAAFGVADFFVAGFAAAAGAAFFAGVLAAALGAADFEAGLAAAAGFAAVLVVFAAARTAMACARGRFVVLSSLM